MIHHRDLIQLCYDKKSSSGESVLSSFTVASQLLRLFCELKSNMFIIIDGIDECDDKEQITILSTLKDVVANCDKQNPGKLRVLIVSQIYSGISKCLSASEPYPEIVSVDARSVERDIKAFVDNECLGLQTRFNLTMEQTAGISELTCNRSQGTS